MLKTYVYGLCEGRHPEQPVKEGIFAHNIARPSDVKNLEDIANKRIPIDCDRLAVYISGMTAAVIAVVNVCRMRNIQLTLYHYNKWSKVYYKQEVL